MAGMRVVVVGRVDDGTVDLDDLEAKCEEHGDALAAIMVTYPSTHGVYEEGIGEMCELVHRYGGQVYIDGANLNALLGLAKPGQFGGDVSHLNLHKTFCIPHGGGGPGVGPVAVAEHLVPYLPSHPMHPRPERRKGIGPVERGAVRQRGDPGHQLGLHPAALGQRAGARDEVGRAGRQLRGGAARRRRYPILYTGKNGLVAHECIVDLRSLTKATGVTVDDVAKRLIDYGFHAPTVSFPVAGHDDGRADRERGPGRAGPVLRGDDRHPGRDRRGRVWPLGRGGQPAAGRTSHRRRRWWASGSVPTTGRRRVFPRDGRPPSTGRPSPGSTRPTGTATWCVRARRPRPSNPENPDPGGLVQRTPASPMPAAAEARHTTRLPSV